MRRDGALFLTVKVLNMHRRNLHHALLAGSLALILVTALTGLSLELSPAALLAMHLVIATGATGLLVAFLGRHWWPRRSLISHHPNAPLGYLATALVGLLSISGVALLWLTNIEPLRITHNAATYALVIFLGLHGLWRIVRRAVGGVAGRTIQPPLSQSWRTGLLLPATLAFLAVAPGAASTAIPPPPAPASIPMAHAALAGAELPPVGQCAVCHTDATTQWQSSLHAQAVTDDYYLAVATLFIEERGVEAVRYCASCHNPVGLMRGEVDRTAAPPPAGANTNNKAYASRALGVHLPLSDAAAEGVTCTVCHAAVATAAPPHNGNLTLQSDAAALPESAFGRLALRAAPDRHAAQVMPALISDAALCGACHNVYTEAGEPLEPTYDEWLASPYPAEGKTCQSCHMPDVQARRADSGLVQAVAAHGGIPGAPSSLPGTVNDTALLRTAAELALDLQQGDQWRVTVNVTNRGAGHQLPTGAADLRQLWLEVALRDAVGVTVWQSGSFDAYGALTPDTIQFHKVLGDAAGRPVELHRFWVATQVLSDTTLAPRETRAIPFTLSRPDPTRGPYTLTARLLYRDVSQSFAEFALNRPAPDLPIYEMAAAELTVD